MNGELRQSEDSHFIPMTSFRSGRGEFHTSKTNGSHIQKGDLIGMICDPYGEHQEKLISPTDGYIVGINNQPVINQGDALMHIGMED